MYEMAHILTWDIGWFVFVEAVGFLQDHSFLVSVEIGV